MSDADLNNKQPVSQICFKCDFCGKQISVPSVYAGKKGKCPQCKNSVLVPCSTLSSPRENVPIDSKPDLDMLLQPGLPHEHVTADQPKDQQYEAMRESAGLPSLQPPPPLKRKFPWLIDILLYPASTPSLISIGIIIVLPFLVNVVAWLLGPFGFFVSIPGFLLIKIPMVLFLFWYFCECISDSAEGGVRAPETITTIADSGRIFDLVFTWLAFWFPPILYSLLKYPPHIMLAAAFTLPEGESAKDILIYIIQNDIIYCLLWFYAIYFFPIGLLSVISSDSLTGLNPLLILRYIFRTFFEYFLVVVVFHIPTMVLFAMFGYFPNLMFGLPGLPLRFAWVWLLLIVGHLTGRYYYRNEKKLNWDV
jgi:hypothetical protein